MLSLVGPACSINPEVPESRQERPWTFGSNEPDPPPRDDGLDGTMDQASPVLVGADLAERPVSVSAVPVVRGRQD